MGNDELDALEEFVDFVPVDFLALEHFIRNPRQRNDLIRERVSRVLKGVQRVFKSQYFTSVAVEIESSDSDFNNLVLVQGQAGGFNIEYSTDSGNFCILGRPGCSVIGGKAEEPVFQPMKGHCFSVR